MKINPREIKWNKVYGYQVAYWIKGGEVHDVVANFDDDFAWGHDPREGDFLWMMRQVLKEGDIFFDCGANIGLNTLAALRKIGPRGFCYSIEPDPRNVHLLSMTVQANKIPNVHIHPIAISNTIGTTKIMLDKATNLSRLHPDGVDVVTNTLSNFVFYRGIPSLIKCDIEGSEVELIDGAIELFQKHPNHTFRLLMEVHPSVYGPEKDLEKQLIKLLDMGFKFRYVASAGIPQPDKFAELGYHPFKMFDVGNFTRGLYEGVDPEHVLEFACKTHRQFMPHLDEWTNKIVRSVLLERLTK